MVVGTGEVTVFTKVFTAMVVDSMGVGDRRAITLPLMIPEHIKMETRPVFGMDTIGDVTINQPLFKPKSALQANQETRKHKKIYEHYDWAVVLRSAALRIPFRSPENYPQLDSMTTPKK